MRSRWNPGRLALPLLLAVCLRATAATPNEDVPLAIFLESEHGTPALMLRTPQDRVVLVFAGAHQERLSVFASTSVPAEALKRDAEQAARAAGLTGPVQVRRREDSTRADVSLRRPRPLSLSGERTVAYGRMVDALRRNGRRVHAALGVSEHADAPMAAPVLSREHTRVWYSIGAAPRDARLRVRVTLSPWHWLLALAVCLGGLAPLLALARGIQIALRRGEHPLGRAWRVSLLGTLLFFPGIVTCFCAATLLMSGTLATVLDLWFAAFGGPLFRNALIGYPAAYGVAALALWGMKLYLARLGETEPWRDAAMSPHAMAYATSRTTLRAPEPDDPDPAERSLRRRIARWKTVVRVGAFVAALVAPDFLPEGWRGYRMWLELPLLFIAGAGVDWAFRKKSAPYRKHTPDPELTKEAQALAVRLGIVVREVEVDDTWEGRAKVAASFRKGRVVVSRRAVEVITPSEMRFVLLNAVAGMEDIPDTGNWGIAAILLTTLGYVALSRPLMKSDPALWFLLSWVCILPALALMILPMWLFGRRRKRRLRQVMDILGDPEAAVTALLKRNADDAPPGAVLKIIEQKMAETGTREPIPEHLRAALSKGGPEHGAREERP